MRLPSCASRRPCCTRASSKLAVETEAADAHLEGEYSIVTTGDTELKDARNVYISFLQTTCARYYEAGSRLNDAVRTYYGNDAESESVLNHLKNRPDLNGAKAGDGGPVDKHVKESKRDSIKDWPEPERGRHGRELPY